MKAFRLFTGHATSPSVLPPDLRAELPQRASRTCTSRTSRPICAMRSGSGSGSARAAARVGQARHGALPVRALADPQPSGLAHVARCVEAMRDYTVSVEFRNKTWFDDAHLGDALAFERELNVVHTVVDAPQGFHNSVPPVWESTHMSYSLVRLHGRNPRPGTSRERRSPRSASTTTIRTPSSRRSPRASSGSRPRPSRRT